MTSELCCNNYGLPEHERNSKIICLCWCHYSMLTLEQQKIVELVAQALAKTSADESDDTAWADGFRTGLIVFKININELLKNI